MKNRSLIQFQISDAFLVGYFSAITYLLVLSNEAGYIDYYNIPIEFINTNVFKSVGYLIPIVLIVLALYTYVYTVFSGMNKKIFPIEKKSLLYLILAIIFKVICTISPVFYFYYTSNHDLLSTYIYMSITFTIVLTFAVVEILVHERNIEYYPIVEKISVNVTWIVCSFVFFWSSGTIAARDKKDFLTIDSGKNVIVYISGKDLFTKPIVNKVKRIKSDDFTLFTLKDSIYNFKQIRFE